MKHTLNPFRDYTKTRHVMTHFVSMGEFAAWVKKGASTKRAAFGGSFYDNETMSSACTKIVTGDKATADKTRDMLHKVAGLSVKSDKRTRVADKFGRASVGAYLGGSQAPCRRVVKQKVHNAPVTLVIGCASSGGVDTDILRQRGIAVAALVMRLSQDRPVRLVLSGFANAGRDGDSHCILIDFPTTPIDAPRLVFALANQGFCRGLLFAAYDMANKAFEACGAMSETGGFITWPCLSTTEQGGQYAAALQKHFGGKTLYIADTHLYNRDLQQMLKDPVAWVNATAAALT